MSIILPAWVEQRQQRESSRRLQEAMEQHRHARYYIEHAVCPKCGTEDHETTCMGTHVRTGGSDDNRVRCGCGWSGRVHDKISRNAFVRNGIELEIDKLLESRGWTDSDEPRDYYENRLFYKHPDHEGEYETAQAVYLAMKQE